MQTVYINGKFAAQRTTGVQRMARANVEALDDEIAEGASSGVRWVMLCPIGAQPPALRAIEIRMGGPTRGSLHLWEQGWLAWASRDGALLSLSGSAPLLRRRQVFTIHDVAIFDYPTAYTRAYRLWYSSLSRALGRLALGILTVSEFSRARIVERLAVAPSRVAVSHLGCEHFAGIEADGAVLERHALHGQRFLLCVASTNPTKNLRALEDAFKSLPHVDARLVVVGAANTRVFSTERQSADDPRILRVGAISDAELKALYQHAQALVFPSLYEGFGLPPVEAMTCGCPVLAARAASIPEVCGDAVHYFDPTDPADIGRAMADLLDGRIARSDLTARGLRVASTLTWRASARRLLNALRVFGVIPPRTR